MQVGVVEEYDFSLFPKIEGIRNDQVAAPSIGRIAGVSPFGRDDDAEMGAQHP